MQGSGKEREEKQTHHSLGVYYVVVFLMDRPFNVFLMCMIIIDWPVLPHDRKARALINYVLCIECSYLIVALLPTHPLQNPIKFINQQSKCSASKTRVQHKPDAYSMYKQAEAHS